MKFSIVTVTLNERSGLGETLDSVIRQSCGDLEVLVVDGGSTDGTVEQLRGVRDSRVNWTSESDRGLYDAMNKGLERARGDYVVFLNAGDSFADEHVLQRVTDAVSTEPRPDLVYGDSLDVTQSGGELYKRARAWTKLWRGMFAQHQAMFFARRRIGNLRYHLNFRLSADYDFIAAFLGTSGGSPAQVVRLDIPLCRFRLGGRSERGRLSALAEDYRVRRERMRLSPLACGALWVAHFGHTLVKRWIPGFARVLRYERSR